MADDATDADEVSVDAEPILAFLQSGTDQESLDRWPVAEIELLKVFPDSEFGLREDRNAYAGETTYANLLDREAPPAFRAWLSDSGISRERFIDALGEIQYVSIQVYLKRLLGSGRARQNRGWSIRLLGFHSLGVVAVGLNHSFSSESSQVKVATASARIREAALRELIGEPHLLEVLEQMPAADSTHYDERGLMQTPVTRVGNVDISGFDGGLGAPLRLVRNTTVKKDVATFFAIRGFGRSDFLTGGVAALVDLRDLAARLGTPS